MTHAVNEDDRKLLLESTGFFSYFDDDELEELLTIGEVCTYPVYDIIIREDQVDYTFFVILRGKVNIVKEDVIRRRHNVASLEEGQCFGEIALLKQGHRSAFVVTGPNCHLFKINGMEINRLKMKTQMKLYFQLARSLAEKLQHLNCEVISKKKHIPMNDETKELSSIIHKLFKNKPTD